MLRITRHIRFSLIMLLGLLLVGQPVRGFENANYQLEEDSIDYGVGTSGSVSEDYPPGTYTTISRPELDGAGAQLRGDESASASYELLSGYLQYDDTPPLFPSQSSSDPDFFYGEQNITLNSIDFIGHVMDDYLPSRATPDPFQKRSGLNLGYNGDSVRIYYKASPGYLNPATNDRTGTWGYSDGGGNWNVLGDDLVGWQPVSAVEQDADMNAARTRCRTHLSCVTETDATLDGVSFQGPVNAERINASVDFTNHPIQTEVSGDTLAIFKAVDVAGNVSFSGAVSPSPWIKADAGDVHSNRKAIQFATPPEDNVAYLISAADTISNFSSSANWEIENYPGPTFVDSLPWTPLDYQGLILTSTEVTAGDLDAFETQLFENGRAYYHQGDLNLSSGGGFAGVQGEGAATVVVDGDLIVEENVTLNGGGYLAFLVRGNILINGTVSAMQGTYVADFDEGDVANSGLVNTGDDGAAPLQLVVTGQLIARSGFVLNRVYIGTSALPQPSELIVFDPQIILNTPPGLKAIPGLGAWEEVRPE